MLLTKFRKLNKNFKILNFLTLIFFILIYPSRANEPVDIWSNQKKLDIKKSEENISNSKNKNDSKINFSTITNEAEIKIEISEEKQNELDVNLIGLFDPQENDLSLDMWANTDGDSIKNTFKRIDKIRLSKFSENMFVNTIMTYSYAPKNKLSEEEFLKLKINWLIKNNKNDIIENFLNNNLEFKGKSKLIKHLVDHYISSADITEGCKKSNFISKEIKENYLERFRIYCLILNKKKEEAQLNFDLLREQGLSDKFFDNKILYLLGYSNKPDNQISDKNLLNFYLSSITVENFNYEPETKTDKNIWKYLTASNLLATDKIEDPKVIEKYETAANQTNFDKKKIIEIYLSVPFNINQLINAQNIYQSLIGYEARALIFQKILLSDDLEKKLDLLFILKDLFKKDQLENVYTKYLSDALKKIDIDDVPDDFRKIVERNIILEKDKELGKVKYDDKILHRSKIMKIFTENIDDKDKINKDLKSIKIKKQELFFFYQRFNFARNSIS